jgi:hypothetical protein
VNPRAGLEQQEGAPLRDWAAPDDETILIFEVGEER